MEISLNLGCGPIHIDGEIGVDRYLTEACDVQADIEHLPFCSNSISKITMDHVLEHFPVKKTVTILLECYRVLAENAKIRVGVPDLEGIFKEYLQADISDKLLWLRTIYGSQAHEGEYHKSGFDKVTLNNILDNIGFKEINIDYDTERTEGICLVAYAVKA